MKRIITTVLAAAVLASLSTGAMAQAKNFEGLNVTGSLGYQTTTVQTTDFSIANVTSSDAQPAGMTASIGAEYITALNSNYTLGFGIESNFLPSQTSRHETYINGVLAANTGGAAKLNSMTTAYIAPGIATS